VADLSQSILRRLRDVRDNPRGVLEQLTDQLNNFNKGRVAEINPSEAGYRNLTMKERSRLMTQGALDNIGGGGLGALGIIKNKGGNWLTGSVENALKPLKYFAHEYSPANVKAFNNWIEGTLAKYVKRDMATEGDPVRKLAEQGILHYEPRIPMGMDEEIVSSVRKLLGYPESGKAKTDLGSRWEHHSDNAIDTYMAGNVAKSGYKVDNPWVANLEPTTPIHEYKDGFVNDIGFSHLTDELANALNPDSGLPRHLQLTPEQMQQLGMEKAVRHVDAINKWRAAQKAEANAKLAQSPAVHMVREYAENNPKGLRWVELKHPLAGDAEDKAYNELLAAREKELGRSLRVDEKKTIADEFAAEIEQGRGQVGEQLKYEGDTMGHCVGGYCDRVLGGEARIFSLRDAKGEPHVTIETRPGDETQSIVQIKGKQNLKPKDEYLPFVQDFVRNHPEGGKWGDIGDLNNAGLYRHHVSKYPESVKDLGEYASKEDIENWIANNVKPTPGFAQGGSVQAPDYFDDLNAFLRR